MSGYSISLRHQTIAVVAIAYIALMPIASHAQETPQKFFDQAHAIEKESEAKQIQREAVDLYLRAAQGGHPEAQFKIGNVYESGIVFPQNYVRAYAWYVLSASNNFESAPAARDRVAKKLSIDAVLEGQQLALELAPKSTPVDTPETPSGKMKAANNAIVGTYVNVTSGNILEISEMGIFLKATFWDKDQDYRYRIESGTVEGNQLVTSSSTEKLIKTDPGAARVRTLHHTSRFLIGDSNETLRLVSRTLNGRDVDIKERDFKRLPGK